MEREEIRIEEEKWMVRSNEAERERERERKRQKSMWWSQQKHQCESSFIILLSVVKRTICLSQYGSLSEKWLFILKVLLF